MTLLLLDISDVIQKTDVNTLDYVSINSFENIQHILDSHVVIVTDEYRFKIIKATHLSNRYIYKILHISELAQFIYEYQVTNMKQGRLRPERWIISLAKLLDNNRLIKLIKSIEKLAFGVT